MTTAAAGRPLQGWFREWLAEADANLLYKKSAEAQIMFVRDDLGRALASSWQQWSGEDENGEGGAVTVIGEHRSKSVRLPVYHVALPGIELVLRDNFYNWKVSVRSDAPIHNVVGWGLFREDEEIHGVYCEGFPREWVHGPYAKDSRRFTVELSGEYEVYAFCLLVRGKS